MIEVKGHAGGAILATAPFSMGSIAILGDTIPTPMGKI